MVQKKEKWNLILRGDTETIEVVLKDQNGLRASKQCSNRSEVETLLDGWEECYGCEAYLLFALGVEAASSEITETLKSWRKHGGARTLNSEATMRAMELAKSPYRPQEIHDLKKQIKAETDAAVLIAEATGFTDPQQIEKIVQMKLDLDGLYGAWTEGTIS